MSNNVVEQTTDTAEKTRASYKQEKKKIKAVEKQKKREQKKQRKAERKKKKIPRKRLFPIPLRIVAVLLLAGIALIVGLMFGYGVLGGHDPQEVLEVETWQHIYDFIFKEK